ncbi:MAG: hypothetical protein LBU45_00200 [Azoarcus sp.]|nr:hypothetical protein [Azoarcus sp.]
MGAWIGRPDNTPNPGFYVAQPPLYRIDVPALGKKRPARRLYALDEGELAAIHERLLKEGVKPEAIDRLLIN